MIRLTLSMTLFAAVLCYLIINGLSLPGGQTARLPAPETGAEVTRNAPLAPFGTEGEDANVATDPADPAMPETERDLKVALVQAIAEGRDEAYLRAMVAHAVAVGAVDEKMTLITARGRIDVSDYLPGAERQVAASGPGPSGAVYVVQEGDSLTSLAEQFYGSGEDYLKIFQANRTRLATPESLRVGQELFIPD